jgi:hypothetical protein
MPSLRQQVIGFFQEVAVAAALPARIKRIWYIKFFGQETCPAANPHVHAALRRRKLRRLQHWQPVLLAMFFSSFPSR